MGTFLPTLESLANAADQSPFIQKLKQAAVDTGKDVISASAPVIAHRILQQTGLVKPGEMYPGETTIKNLPGAMMSTFLGAGGLEEPLAGEHPATATEALGEHTKTGGSTYNPRTGESLAGTRNYAVGVAPEHTAVSDRAFTPQQYSDFVKTNRDLLAQHPSLAVGTHFEPETGLHNMEIVATTPSKQAAGALGARLGEGHVYNLATDEKIGTGVDPSLQRSPVSVPLEQRLADLNAATPQKAPYTGTHFSDSDLELIDGSRRGASASKEFPTAESARLRLGTATGMGPDAPPGFYTYHADALPDTAIAARKNAYTVRGNMAFASTDDPVFQNGYHEGSQQALAAGADPQTAHQLGLNSAEHAARDAGYDGYFSPKHPGVRFHFGDAATKPVGPWVAPDIGEWKAPGSPQEQTRIDTDTYANAMEQARNELGPGASVRDIIARRDQLIGGRPETQDVGAKSRANNPEPTRAESRGTRKYTRTAEDNADTAAFQQARKELGGNATSDDVVARAEQILGRKGSYSLPKTVINGSRDSSASAEAISRAASDRAKGVRYVITDSRSGIERPLIGVDALDTTPGPFDVITRKSPEGDIELARGKHAK